MKIDIYTSTKNGDKHLSVAKGTNIETLILPHSIDADLLTLSPFKTRLEIDPNRTHPTLEQSDILQQIETQGYAIHGAKKVITLNTKNPDTAAADNNE